MTTVLVAAVIATHAGHFPLFLSCAVLLNCSLWLLQKTIRIFEFRQPTIPGVWFLSYLAMSWIPSLIIYLGFSPEGYSYPVFPVLQLQTFLIATCSILVTAPAGIWLANALFRFRPAELQRYFQAPTDISPTRMLPYVTLLGMAVGATLLYFLTIREYPLSAVFKDPGDSTYLGFVREQSFAGLHSPLKYAFSVVREALYPFLIAVALGCYVRTRRRVWLLLFWVALVVGIFYAAASIARGPVAGIILVVICFWYLYKSGRISRWRIFVAAALLLSFPVLVTTLSGPDTTPLDALRIVGIRLFYAPAYVAYVYFEVIPNQVGFQHGATIGKLAWMLGMTHFNMGQYALFTIYRNAPATGSAGGAFFADFYANWGLPGVWVGGMLIGIIMQGIQILLLRQRKTVASLAVYAFMFYAFWMTSSRALPTVLLSTGVSFVLLFWCFFIIADKRWAVSSERFTAKGVAYGRDRLVGGRA